MDSIETFPIVKRKDEAAHGEHRTKRVILEIYDAMERRERQASRIRRCSTRRRRIRGWHIRGVEPLRH